MTTQEKEKKIKREETNLKKICADIDSTKKELAYRICEKAAFLKVNLEECQDDINKNGVYEMFQQSKGVPPYNRTRPVVNTFASFTASYQKYVKQLSDLLPKEKKGELGDGFDAFVDGDGE